MRIFWCVWGYGGLKEGMASALLFKRQNQDQKNLKLIIYVYKGHGMCPRAIAYYVEKYGIQIEEVDPHPHTFPKELNNHFFLDFMRYNVGREMPGPSLYMDADIYCTHAMESWFRDIFEYDFEVYHSARYLANYDSVHKLEKYFGKKEVCFVPSEKRGIFRQVMNLGQIYMKNGEVFDETFQRVYKEIINIHKKVGLDDCRNSIELIFTSLFNVGELGRVRFLPEEHLTTGMYDYNFIERPYMFYGKPPEDIEKIRCYRTQHVFFHAFRNDDFLRPFIFKLEYNEVADAIRIVFNNRKDVVYMDEDEEKK